MVVAFTFSLLIRTIITAFVLNVEKYILEIVLIFDLFLLTTPSFLVIFVLFARIIHKLSKMNRVGVAGNNMEMVGRGENVAPPTQTREKHVVAVKTFGAVTACLLISYIPGYLAAAGIIPYPLILLFYLNHICNPFIYFFCNQEFRKSVVIVFK